MDEVKSGDLIVLEDVLRSEKFSHDINPLIERLGSNISQLDPTLRGLLSECELTPKTILSLDSVLSPQHFDLQKSGIAKRKANFEKFQQEMNNKGFTSYAKYLLDRVGSAIKQLTPDDASDLHRTYNELSPEVVALLKKDDRFGELFKEGRSIRERIAPMLSDLVLEKGRVQEEDVIKLIKVASRDENEELCLIFLGIGAAGMWDTRCKEAISAAMEKIGEEEARQRSSKSDAKIAAEGQGLLPSPKAERSAAVPSKDDLERRGMQPVTHI